MPPGVEGELSMSRTSTRGIAEKHQIIILRKMGWSQAQISRQTSIPQQTISYWLSHDIKMPSLARCTAIQLRKAGLDFEKIAELMGISPSIIERWARGVEVDEMEVFYYQRLVYDKNDDTATLANIGKDWKFTNNGKAIVTIPDNEIIFLEWWGKLPS